MNLQTRAEHGILSSNDTIQIQIGDICCSITCDDKEVLDSLYQLYNNFRSDKPADININLEVVERFSASTIKSASSQSRGMRQGSSYLAIFRLNENESETNHRVNIMVERHQLSSSSGYKIMNLLLPPSYYTAHRIKHGDSPRAMLVHSCGILRQGQVLLFTGPSETGKTTVAQLCGSEYGQVVNDEMVLVSQPDEDSNTLFVQGVPIIGGVTQRLNVKSPLAFIILLKQSRETSFRRLSRLEAYTSFMRQVIAPRNLEQSNWSSMLLQVSQFSDSITRSVPFYELQFSLDRERLWEVIGELEESHRKDG